MAKKFEVKTLLEKRSNRGDYRECLINFLANVYRPIYLAHTFIKNKPAQGILETFIKLYLIALVSCLETFYRDLFRLLLDSNPQKTYQPRTVSEKKLNELLQAGLHINDVFVEFPGLQNAKNITETLDQYFPPNGYIATLSEGFNCKILSKSPEVIHFQLFPDWAQKFEELFEARHRYVHDANSKSVTSVKVMPELETLVLLIPQITIWRLSSPAHRLISKKGNQSFPALLIVEDLLSDEWEIADNYDDHGFSIGIEKP